MNIYFDTSVFVAASIAQHPHHIPARDILQSLHKSKRDGYTSTHTLAEFYSVLTRAPFKPPVYPAEASQLIDNIFDSSMNLVALTAKESRSAIKDSALKGLTGGKIHDALHLACAAKASCDLIYTFNLRDFRLIAVESVLHRIRSPLS